MYIYATGKQKVKTRGCTMMMTTTMIIEAYPKSGGGAHRRPKNDIYREKRALFFTIPQRYTPYPDLAKLFPPPLGVGVTDLPQSELNLRYA